MFAFIQVFLPFLRAQWAKTFHMTLCHFEVEESKILISQTLK